MGIGGSVVHYYIIVMTVQNYHVENMYNLYEHDCMRHYLPDVIHYEPIKNNLNELLDMIMMTNYKRGHEGVVLIRPTFHVL